ncbi:hexose kinase [Enterococcus sp. CWB-B31]|uniref:hexose kinase n=1 Tax=Enterococcus sp. CWB-B31 TaxID=2885159 RepID=UPI001E5E3C0E|nr:hexose kinase [Enterococcus sp. CWB-B31]MCB5954556.1 hexose kinase [Enterococcus sp. CWB-B31]
MILTVTLNPSIDISYFVDHFQLDTVNRTTKITKTPGGKGLNVTRVLKQMNIPVLATGFIGGHIGELLKEGLDYAKIQHSFSPIKGETRDCIAILSENKQTEVLEAGPTISEEEISAFLEHFSVLIKDTELITISGSLPEGFSPDFYQQLLALAAKEKRPVLLDTSGNYMYHALAGKHKPFLIKPNHHEIAEFLQKKASKDIEVLRDYLNDPLFDDIEYIIVTLGSEGALIKNKETLFKASLPKIDVVSPVGSGDASLAGIAAALFKQQDLETAIKTSMTAGLLNTLEAQTGSINIKKFDDYFKQIHIKEL